jgi:hypothetical protein
MHGQEHARCCAALLNARPMGFYAAARIVRDACDHDVDTSYYNWCKIAQIAATENSDPHVDPYMSCEKVPSFNLEYKHLLRKAAKRTVEATWRQIGALLDDFSPEECQRYLVNAGYGST